jgi:hypothetical protein
MSERDKKERKKEGNTDVVEKREKEGRTEEGRKEDGRMDEGRREGTKERRTDGWKEGRKERRKKERKANKKKQTFCRQVKVCLVWLLILQQLSIFVRSINWKHNEDV